MDHISTVVGSTSWDNTRVAETKRKETFLSRCTEVYESKQWKPPALRVPVLIFTIAICWGLIALLEVLLHKSQRDNGVIFAPVINDLPLRTTFLYLYFPTIVAVIFSIYWAWIDLETKRMEPYYQLSKENGALGKDSLLLHYPFSFIPLAPLKAFRDRHWPVFWGSLAVVLVTWGLVPTQAGIFSVQTVTRSTNRTFAISTSLMPFEKQATSLTMRFMQSTYGIAQLNETLPPYMTRNFTLAPFEPVNSTNDNMEGYGTYTGPTTMYQINLTCEDASHKSNRTENSQLIAYKSSTGCKAINGLTGNLTRGDGGPAGALLTVREYIGRYIGYHNGGYADYYLSPYCPKTANTTFYAAIEKSKVREEDPPNDVTAVFCYPQYWQQEVSATVDRLTKRPLTWEPLKERQPLPWNVLNMTNFEALLNSGNLGVHVRGDVLPTTNIPRYLESIAPTNLSMTSGLAGLVQPMVGLALATPGRPMGDYLDWRVLSEAYVNAYQLLFARVMVDVLGVANSSSKEASGYEQVTSEAVVLEPVFVHIVVGFLGVVSLAAIALLYLSLIHRRNLGTDPSTIASVMAMVADNHMLLSDFSDLDCCTEEDMAKIIAQKRYKLIRDEYGTSLLEITDNGVFDHGTGTIGTLGQRRDSPTSIAKPVRPIEFSLCWAVPFVLLFVTLVVALGVVYAKAHANGLPIPSSNTIVQNILENYIPTAIATLIEPMWILINRLLCMLQPLEELQDCNAKAKESIDANYNSLPPQLVVFKALKTKHFVLAAVCTMALLANLLAVAFSGLFNQGLSDIRYGTTFQPPYQYKVVSINGSVGPNEVDTFGTDIASGAYQGGNGEDQFLVAESNTSSNTPLPSWTDDSLFYLPFFAEEARPVQANKSYFEATTQGLGADLDCTELKVGNNFALDVSNSTYSIQFDMNMTIKHDTGDVRCGVTRLVSPGTVTAGPLGNEVACVSGPTANELVTMVKPRQNATQHEREVCMSTLVFAWMRWSNGTCPLGTKTTMDPKKSLFVQCRPKIVTGSAHIQVDASGRLQRPVANVTMNERANNTQLFSNSVSNIIGQSNLYLFRYTGGDFHNDSFAGDYMNYFMRRWTNSTRLIDPTQPVPTFDEVIRPLNKAYSKLFAIWLGINKKNLFVPLESGAATPVSGYRVQPEQRLFVSTTMFIISQAILSTYVIVAIWVYARRPGQYLARMPTSIASVIALFAASTAVEDMRGTSHLDKKGRARHLERLDSRYGFGSFIGGGDGRVHIGIEKCPLVLKPRAKTSWLEQMTPLLRKRSGGLV